MVSSGLDVERFFRRPDAVAAVAQASELFGLLRRSIDLPRGWSALATRKTGDHVVCRPGSAVMDQGLSEVLFARSAPLDVHFDERALLSADQQDCTAAVHLRVLTIPERSELACLRDAVLGSSRMLLLAGLMRFLQPYVREALEAHAHAHAAADLVERLERDALERELRAALDAVTFSAGLQVCELVSITFDSAGYRALQQAEIESGRVRQQQEAERQLHEARAAAQRQHLDHLSGLLTRLDELSRRSPAMRLGDLMRTFSESERSELYQALFASASPQRWTRWIVAAAGNELLYFDPANSQSPMRRISLDTQAGGLRSIQLVTPADGAARLWVGAASGVHEVALEGTEPPTEYIAPHLGLVRGGFNSVALTADRVLASHSELGLWAWPRDGAGLPVALLEEQTRAARSVRDVQVLDEQVLVAIDERVLMFPAASSERSAPHVLSGSSAAITALTATPHAIFAGNSDGAVLTWERARGGEWTAAPRMLYGPTRRPVESIACLEIGGVARLFFTDNSPAVHARVVGDTFTCDYQAGGQILRRASAAPDYLVAMVEARDRLICWALNQPEQPTAVLPISRLTGHSIQDACLVPVLSAAC
jgi:hypothetical protein